LTLAQAVPFTLDFENSLIEKNVFTHFDSTSEKARIILNRLVMETQSHVKKYKASGWISSAYLNSPFLLPPWLGIVFYG